ncbi:prephenate dehydrogenase [Flavobacteriaceae bacterium]|jgi:prephenate dehydrogenase|nr:prephenate dehydrogenase [Flavobacteriaceae bacterium]MDC0496998.1 prephenate dehydrogenase [Flavobacteriaceae bacterium]|tara:strand:- start:684 stop:1535 length:852 start_codon:yes stop_codon:yes gene_type:complete
MNNVFVIGVGLIGGSLCLDIKKIYPKVKIYGIDSSVDNLDLAVELNLIDFKTSLDNLNKADLVLISTPVDVANKIIIDVLNNINSKSLVIDFGSTKTNICSKVNNHKKRKNYLASHPIAGTEFSGPKAAFLGLFSNKTIILCDSEKTDTNLLTTAENIFRSMQMNIRYMDSFSHDKHIAYVSHLSHISSFMLGKTVMDKEKNENNIFDMAGSGFESTVRLAKSSPEMWAPIFELNKENIVESLEEYIVNLNSFKNLLQNDKFGELKNQMIQTNYIKNILKGLK